MPPGSEPVAVVDVGAIAASALRTLLAAGRRVLCCSAQASAELVLESAAGVQGFAAQGARDPAGLPVTTAWYCSPSGRIRPTRRRPVRAALAGRIAVLQNVVEARRATGARDLVERALAEQGKKR